MSTSSIVRIACQHKGRQQFWTVQQGGALRLGDASQAQLFVCRCEETANRSYFIQHLQSGAFIEQGETRKLQLALSSASAAVFSKLKAYSEGKARACTQRPSRPVFGRKSNKQKHIAGVRPLYILGVTAAAMLFPWLTGEESVPKGSVWLRAATGGLVCSNSHGELTVTVNADQGCYFQHCAFSFINADANR